MKIVTFVSGADNCWYEGYERFYSKKYMMLLFGSRDSKIKKIDYSKKYIEYRKIKFEYCKK